jgi:hypothetical protein
MWFHTGVRHSAIKDNETRQWLQGFEDTQRRAMYDPAAHFTRATKEGDHDFATFGQCAISIGINKRADGLLYRCWHLRDMAWQENEEGTIGFVCRKWKPGARTLVQTFKDKVDQKVKDIADKAPFEEMEVMHLVVDAEMYDDDARGLPRWSIYYDKQNSHVMFENLLDNCIALFFADIGNSQLV